MLFVFYAGDVRYFAEGNERVLHSSSQVAKFSMQPFAVVSLGSMCVPHTYIIHTYIRYAFILPFLLVVAQRSNLIGVVSLYSSMNHFEMRAMFRIFNQYYCVCFFVCVVVVAVVACPLWSPSTAVCITPKYAPCLTPESLLPSVFVVAQGSAVFRDKVLSNFFKIGRAVAASRKSIYFSRITLYFCAVFPCAIH